MKVRLETQFEAATAEDEEALASVARSLTNDPQSVRVVPSGNHPHGLVAEFTMATEAQYKAVDRIDARMRFPLGNRLDSIISFPKDAAARSKRRRRKT